MHSFQEPRLKNSKKTLESVKAEESARMDLDSRRETYRRMSAEDEEMYKITDSRLDSTMVSQNHIVSTEGD